MIKKTNILFLSFKKAISQRSINLDKRLTIILIIVLSLFESHHQIYSQIRPDPQNPFFDVFYLYYDYQRERAKKILKEQFDNPELKYHAYINYGLINEYEKNYRQAEKYYKLALEEGEKSALMYLLNLYKKHNSVKYIRLLKSIKARESDYWIDYETAVYYLKKRDNKNALKYLRIAIDKDFNSTILLKRDPVFDILRESRAFKRLIRKTRKTSLKRKSLLEQLHNVEYTYRMNKPYGMNRELTIVAYLEKTGRDKEAEEILSSLLKSRIPFRERNMALFWMARIKAKNGKYGYAKKYLEQFIDHIKSGERDNMGYKSLITPIYRDIILNDRYLKSLL